MAFLNTVVARAAASIWGLKLGKATTDAVLMQMGAGSPADIARVVNEAHNRSFGAMTNEQIAASFVANFGMTGAVATAATADVLSQLASTTSTTRGAKLLDIATVLSGLTSDPTYGSFANAFNARVAYAANYAAVEGSGDLPIVDGASGTTYILGTGRNNVVGSSGDDMIAAYIQDNSNTLQSGDFVDGGAGTDTLYADMGSSQNFAVTPSTVNVERIVIRGESRATDTGDNNIQGEGRVLIDAQRIVGENRLESNNSRADVIIEDERIAASQITKDITIAFVESDPGNVDFAVYFDQHSLRASSSSSATLTLEIIDQKAAAEGNAPLKDSPFDGFRMQLNGVDIQFTSQAFNDAQTYAQLLTAVQSLLALDPRTNGVVTAALGSNFTVQSATGVSVTGQQIVLSATNATLGVGSWIALAGVPPGSDTYTNQFTGFASADDLVTSTIILDDVGRGSNGGDLVVGGLSVGETSTSRGVDRFEITVERTSRVQNIDSTNNWLKEVTFRNGTTNGDVVVNGNSNSMGDGTQNAMPGAVANHDAYGFNDVRMIDASAMLGKVTFDALISTNSFAKYVETNDTGVNPASDNTSNVGKTYQKPDFVYTGGTNNDTMIVDVDADVVTSNNTVLSSREDTSFSINGGAGNDSITFRIIDGVDQTGLGENDALGGSAYPPYLGVEAWYQHQKWLANATVDGGDGNDTIRTPGAGDVIIRLGAGADTVYTDNTGSNVPNAQWVFNTRDQTTAAAAGAGADDARQLDNLLSSSLSTYNLYKGSLTVQFLGTSVYPAMNSVPLVSKSVQIGWRTTDFRTNDLYINQAIKNAINTDPVLSKLLVANDGPGYTLVVTSLIDGARVAANLRVNIVPPTETLSATEIVALNTAWSPTTAWTAATPSSDVVNAMSNAATGVGGIFSTAANLGRNLFDLEATNDYRAALTHNDGAERTGANSETPSDNTITGALGNDVIVLGTTESASADAAGPPAVVGLSTAPYMDSSNERVVYAGAFDNDTIVNFDISGNGIDTLDFRAYFNNASPSSYTYDAAVPVIGEVGTYGGGTGPGILAAAPNRPVYAEVLDSTAGSFNNTAAKVQALFADVQGAGATTTRYYVYVAVNPLTNVGTLYQVIDSPGVSNVSATLMGTIDLADVTWASLTLPNFN